MTPICLFSLFANFGLVVMLVELILHSWQPHNSVNATNESLLWLCVPSGLGIRWPPPRGWRGRGRTARPPPARCRPAPGPPCSGSRAAPPGTGPAGLSTTRHNCGVADFSTNIDAVCIYMFFLKSALHLLTLFAQDHPSYFPSSNFFSVVEFLIKSNNLFAVTMLTTI